MTTLFGLRSPFVVVFVVDEEEEDVEVFEVLEEEVGMAFAFVDGELVVDVEVVVVDVVDLGDDLDALLVFLGELGVPDEEELRL